MKKSVRTRGIFWMLLGVLFGTALELSLQWDRLSEVSNQSGLRYEEAGLSGEQIEAYRKRRDVEIAAWKPEKNRTISLEELRRSTVGTVIRVFGSMELVVPFGLKSGGVPFLEDEKGCMISSGLAWELFGTDQAVGNSLELDGSRLWVRGILNQEEPLLVLYQRNPEERMPYVEIRARDQSPAPVLSQIAGGLGLFGETYVFNGSYYVSAARILISLPVWFVYFFLSRRFLRWCKGRRKRSRLIFAAWGLVLLGAAAGIFLSVSVTSDFIPAQWSDFEFWREKARKLIDWSRNRRNFPPVFWEEEVLGCMKRIAAGAAVSLGCLGGMIWIYNFGRRKTK